MITKVWIPFFIGGILGILDYMSLAVNFLIPLGPFGATGPQEALLTIAAALGGPIGLFVATCFHSLGIFNFFLKAQLSPEEMSSVGRLVSLTDFAAHILALLALAYLYKFLQRHARKIYIILVGWILIVVIYYTLLVLLQFFLVGMVVPDIPPLTMVLQNNLPEFLVVMIITTLFTLAMPERYRRPLWIERQTIQSNALGMSTEQGDK